MQNIIDFQKTHSLTDYYVDYYKFAKHMFHSRTGDQFIENWHHKVICEHLEKILIGDIKKIIINIPPRYSKTELAVTSFIPWLLGIVPDAEFMHVSYTKDLALNNSAKCRDMVLSNAYKEIFPHIELKKDSQSKGKWITKQGGCLYAVGTGGAITGFGAGKRRDRFGGAIILDDPHKAGEVNSERLRHKVLEWFEETMRTRLNNKSTAFILIMQRLHVDDLTGFLLKNWKEYDWTHLKIPALDENDKPLWSHAETAEDLKLIRKLSPYVFAGQFMQDPTPQGGGLFKDGFWNFYKELPQMEYKIITGDTAQKTGERNDYSVFQCWGFYENNIYLIDQIRDKWEATPLKQNFIAFWHKHATQEGTIVGALRCAYIEDKSSGTGLIQDCVKEEGIPIKPIQRVKDKYTRALDNVPYIETGLVQLPQLAPWISDYLTEFSRFNPGLNTYDDQIDPTLDAIDILLAKRKKGAFVW